MQTKLRSPVNNNIRLCTTKQIVKNALSWLCLIVQLACARDRAIDNVGLKWLTAAPPPHYRKSEVNEPTSSLRLRCLDIFRSTRTERYLGCRQKQRFAVNDRMGIEPDNTANSQ